VKGLNESQIKKLREVDTASFAIWDEDIVKCLTTDISRFNPNVIFISINPSKTVKAFQNFHRKNKDKSLYNPDRTLRDIIQGTLLSSLYGAYMTDIAKHADSKVNEAEKHIKEEDVYPNFLKQVKILDEVFGHYDRYFLIVLGNRPIKYINHMNICDEEIPKYNDFNLQPRCYEGKLSDKSFTVNLSIYKVYHHGMQNYRHRSDLSRQLEHINNAI
jgi:hypothetical protein